MNFSIRGPQGLAEGGIMEYTSGASHDSSTAIGHGTKKNICLFFWGGGVDLVKHGGVFPQKNIWWTLISISWSYENKVVSS